MVTDQLLRTIREARPPWRLELLDPADGQYRLTDADDREIARVWGTDALRVRRIATVVNAAALLATIIDTQRAGAPEP